MLKTPVSMLQELTQLKKIPIPLYEYKQVSMVDVSYTCTVSIGDRSNIGHGVSKKTAKQEAAKNMLMEEFDVKFDLNNSDMSMQIPNVNLKTSKFTAPLSNYIGNLNELCAKHSLAMPLYNDRSSIEFVVDCVLNDLITTGYGYNRKSAKQESARKMLELLKNSDTIALMKDKSLNNITYHSNNIKEELEKNELDVVVKKLENLRSQFSDSLIEKKPSTSSETADQSIEISDDEIDSTNITSWKDMETFLDNHNFKHKLEVFQEDPIMLCLKINDSVLMSNGISRNEAEKKLITLTFGMLKDGFKFKS